MNGAHSYAANNLNPCYTTGPPTRIQRVFDTARLFDYVFYGKIISIENEETTIYDSKNKVERTISYNKVTFKIETVLKGSITSSSIEVFYRPNRTPILNSKIWEAAFVSHDGRVMERELGHPYTDCRDLGNPIKKDEVINVLRKRDFLSFLTIPVILVSGIAVLFISRSIKKGKINGSTR